MVILGIIITQTILLFALAGQTLIGTIGINILLRYPPLPKFIRTWLLKQRIRRDILAGKITTITFTQEDLA